jgi:EAL and modified HD-GYP domain-containing signal transduction protein
LEFAFLGRQPVVDAEEKTLLYSLLFRRSNARKVPFKDAAAGYSVAISELMHSFNIESTLDGKKGILKVDDQTIIKTDLSILPAKHLIFELAETTHFSVKVSKVIEELMDKGYEFSLSHKLVDEVILKRGEDFLARFSMLVFNVRKLDFDVLYKHELLIKKLKMTLMATKVETKQGFEMCKRLGFTYFVGYFFEQPEILKGKKLTANEIALVQILSKLQNDDEIDEIVKTIRYAPDVSVLLLKFINSADFSTKKEIDTISQAVKLLGRKNLTSWVTLTLFAGTEGKPNQTLIDTALMRARMMELLCGLLKRKEYESQAYMVGLLSLSDTIFKISMRDIVEHGYFTDAVKSALLQGEGELGKILKLAVVVEHGNYKKIELISRKLSVPIDELSLMFNDAFSYVLNVKKALKEN